MAAVTQLLEPFVGRVQEHIEKSIASREQSRSGGVGFSRKVSSKTARAWRFLTSRRCIVFTESLF